MVFKRRDPRTMVTRLRELFYPRGGWGRALQYMWHRVRRLPDSPQRVSIGLAVGAMMSFTPFFGFHIVLAMLVAWMLRGNVIAGVIGTFVGNPVTFPFIATGSLGLGRWMLGLHGRGPEGHTLVQAFFDGFKGIWLSIMSLFGKGSGGSQELGSFFWDLFLPYLLGGPVIGLIVGIATYYVSVPLVRVYQARRKEKMRAKARAHLEQRYQAKAGQKPR